MLLELQKGIVYGPIHSRRLGRSLGINILPARRKVCSLNCVYCQYGWTQDHMLRIKSAPDLPTTVNVKETLQKALIALDEPPAYITFSGNGEPTLHPDFPQIVEDVISLRDRLTPESQTAILSNSTTVIEKSMRKALSRLDIRIMKLDCGSPELFRSYNQPCPGVDLDAITQGLSRLPDVAIQTVVSSGQSGNLDSKNLTAWIDRLKHIRPLSVQLYTLDRDFPAKDLDSATHEDLLRIQMRVQKAGIPAHVF